MTQELDLSPLSADYDIVGQLDDAESGRTYIATRKSGTKRRDDQTGVLISVVGTPDGDEANALSHLAADTKLLAATPHRRLLPILDGRWLGHDAFAVITQRTSDPSLAQRLSAGETFTNPRVAAILREINGLLEWARNQKIVHRSIPLSRVFLEPRTDRVRVSFAIAPIRRLHRSDAQDDARTIARLAVAMLTGMPDAGAYDNESLAELRPDLPERLREATAVLLDEKNTGADPDVPAFLALIGMADPVAAGEAERERIRAEILDEQRAERDKLAGERAAFEQEMAAARAAFAAEQEAERAAFERAKEAERAAVERQRLELEKAVTREREALQRAVSAERAELVAKRAELEKIVADQRAELERAAARDRQQIEDLRERLRRVGEHEIEKKRQTALEDIDEADDALDREELAAPTFMAPMFAPLDPLVFNDDSPLMANSEVDFADALVEPAPVVVEEPVTATVPAGTPTRRRRNWVLAGSAAAIVAAVGIGATLLGGREPSAAPRRTAATTSAVAPAIIVPTTPAPAASAPAAPTVPAPLPMDSATVRTATRWLDSLKDAHPVEIPRAPRVIREPTTEERVTADRPAPAQRPAQTTRPARSIADDPFFIPGSSTPAPRRDSTARPDTTTPPRR